ncbi:MAG: hypothetical protein CVV51_06960 [Spirochaetae bacterium HGW-Spirochaetae-7]|jgi:hypothetical protein|nr:MAG: hypothetical protein CVV51_06960 [Spirochaetae bacterium HGW-Spirochaetae-7]
MTPILYAIVAQILVCLVVVLWTRSTVRKFLGSGEELERIRREIGALIVELDSSADRNVTVLEDRLKALKELVGEADKRLAMLGQDRTRRQAENVVYDRLGRNVASAALSASQVERSAERSAERAPERVQTSVPEFLPEEAAQQAAPEVPFIRFSDKPLPIEEPFADKVLSLSRRGFSSDIIAARLGATIAEIDLVISLEGERDGRSKER